MVRVPRDPVTLDDAAADWLWAIADELSAAALITHLRCTRGVLDLIATMHRSGHRETDVTIDDDGCIELRYWADPAATPAQVANAITAALAAVTADLSGSAQSRHEQSGGPVTPLPARCAAHQPDSPTTGYDGAVTERAGDGAVPGPKDPPTERPASDVARPADTGSLHPELAKRLEQLPYGHPSSPYNADGTRRPPVPDPFKNELPIPGDPGFRSDAPDTSQVDRPQVISNSPMEDRGRKGETAPKWPTEDKPLLDAHGSWKWHGRELPPEACRIADALADRCREAEGRDASGGYGDQGLTPAMHRIEAELDHGYLVDKTEEYALKTADRFKEKLATLIDRFPGTDPKELAEGIHDGVRYTFIFDFEHYTDSIDAAQIKLQEAGYERIETKPGWHGDEYKGVNSQWTDPASGVRFEVQFHTQESWDAKQITHKAYEEINAPSTPIEKKERLRAYQREVSSTVSIPTGALDIPAYKKEGR